MTCPGCGWRSGKDISALGPFARWHRSVLPFCSLLVKCPECPMALVWQTFNVDVEWNHAA